jgi:hypothetical protein
VLALTVVSIGVAVATVTDLQFHLFGACVALAWIVPSAVNKILWSRLQQQENWTALSWVIYYILTFYDPYFLSRFCLKLYQCISSSILFNLWIDQQVDVEDNAYYFNFPGCYVTMLRPSRCTLLWLELEQYSGDFRISHSWILAAVVGCFGTRVSGISCLWSF